MKLRKKIILTNVITLLLALMIPFLAGSSMFRASQDKFYAPDNIRLEEHIFTAGEILMQQSAPDAMCAALDDLSYRLYVLRGNDVVLRTIDPFQQRLASLLEPADWPQDTVQYLLIDGCSIAGLSSDGAVYLAMHSAAPPKGAPEGTQFEAFHRRFNLVGLIAIVLVLVCSTLLSSRLLKKLLRPVNALVRGAGRVAAGDLSQRIDASREDDLKPVVSAFNEMQARLQEQRVQSEASEKARIDMIAGISHDLRTPLTSVKGYIKGLRDGVANTPEKQARYLDVAYRKSCDMEALLQKLFDFSRMETGNWQLCREMVSLSAFAADFCAEAQEELLQKGAALELSSTPGAHLTSLDRGQMNRVLANLTENALKYAKVQPLQLTIRVWREYDAERLSFADNGAGVPESQLAQLFDEFWRGDASRSPKNGEGSGLGLYISKCIVQAHGGTITVKNENGLRFDVTLPAREDGQ
ncbi:MAG: HAMP domain-containing sensor histidine kinase [Oscillospiraceae bacterium]|nr:HAMP domain-containing sensor histidine kinase [Oscillospiraceae bacterium]